MCSDYPRYRDTHLVSDVNKTIFNLKLYEKCNMKTKNFFDFVF